MQRGSLYQSAGRWYARYYENGRRVSRPLGQGTRIEARRDLARVMDEVNRSNSPDATLERVAERYVQAAPGLRPPTAGEYRGMFRRYIEGSPDCQRRLIEYRTAEVQAILDRVAGNPPEPLGFRTLAHIKFFLSSIFVWAAQQGFRDGNPVRETRIPSRRASGAPTYAYSLAEVQAGLAVLCYPERAAWALAAFAGLSQSEMQGLRWQDISADALAVNQTIVKGIVGEPKTKARGNTVPLIPQLKTILHEYQGVVWHGINGNGERLFREWLDHMGRYRVRQALTKAGIAWRGWHAHRRGLATNLLELGIDPLVVQRILRHSNLEVTLGHYAKIRDQKAVEAMGKLAESLMGGEEQNGCAN